MIVRLFRFQLLIWMVKDCLISMFIQMEALVLEEQKLYELGKLFCHEMLVDVVEVNVGLNMFGLWLKEFWLIIMFGFLMWSIFEMVLKKCIGRICFTFGFVDILPLFRIFFPEKHSRSQEKLYEDIVCKTYVVHNSMVDVVALSAILKEVNVTKTMLQP